MIIKDIVIYSIAGKKYVRSYEFFKAYGSTYRNYTRWVVSALNVGIPGVDYLPCPENTHGRTIRYRLRFYFDIDFAGGLCLRFNNVIELRKLLIQKKESDQGMIVINSLLPKDMDLPSKPANLQYESRKKKVNKLDLQGKIIKKYNSASEAAKDNNLWSNRIHDVCNGLIKTSGGFKWEYEE